MVKSSKLTASGSPCIRNITLPYDIQKTQVGFGMVCTHFSPISSSYVDEILENHYENLLPFLEIPPY